MSGAQRYEPGRDLLITAYRTLGRSLNLHRNGVAAVRLAVPRLARSAALVLALDEREAQWWTPSGADEHAAVAGLPGWIRADLADAGAGMRRLPPGRWVLPDGVTHDGHGVVVRITCPFQGHGALVLLRDGDQPLFAESDLSLVAEFSGAVSRAMTGALLYREQARFADALRATLLPAPLPVIAGLELAAVYRPAREALRIGGDILHVEPRAGGGALCVLGDVCGKGVEAAVAGNRLRQAVQVLRRLTGRPLEMLQVLNDTTFDPDAAEATQFATMIIGVAEALPHGGALLRLAAGGHPPPLVIRQTGTVNTVHVGGMMLGAEHRATFTEANVWLAPGETCLLYTDGVTDAAGGPQGHAFGRDRLAALVAGYAGRSAALLAERIAQRTDDWLASAGHDDITVLAIRAG
ncbi:PP2C family protein-serine/threonine phosphatase [Actinoplanes oblitus]|uniref:PP2C family protein-serine/threonine phosphatase n=1 Tax=Actinoplanes oblitus TaxID=3040509 RepID=A0ABY8WSL6_9ACTN|nr:PP2C family protein-serine/threonine phosphatase [Actinoplanes oblitus]WIM99792.1 PP2C family protein-serine/threonine phosphatase [Actinoplanes oblitus]